MKIKSYKSLDVTNKYVLLRLDINAPLKDGRIVDKTRLEKSIPTLDWLLEHDAKVAILAHQGDTLDYQNMAPLQEHAGILAALCGKRVGYIDDVCGPAAIDAVKTLKMGEAVLLGNVRYLAEEISTFETVVKLTATEMTKTWLVRSLAPFFDYYVNDAFSAAHRAAPSMIAFQEILPSAAGDLLFTEYNELENVLRNPQRPAIFVLGGAKISDAFGMLDQVLNNKTADTIITVGVTAQIFLLAKDIELGETSQAWLQDRKLLDYVSEARSYLDRYGDRFVVPVDLAYEKDKKRVEVDLSDLPVKDALYMDIGERSIENAEAVIRDAGSLFVNGPAGVYEDERFNEGTKRIWRAIAASKGHSVLGGGDSVSAAHRFIDTADVNFISSAGGAMVRFMAGETLPLIDAMQKAGERDTENKEKATGPSG